MSTELKLSEEEVSRASPIDAERLKAALLVLSDAFVKGYQSSYGMRIPAEPYRDGDLVCGSAYRLIVRLESKVRTLRDALDCLLPGLALDLRYADEDDDKDALQSRIHTVVTALREVQS